MPVKPKPPHREPNRIRARTSVTLDPATHDRLKAIVEGVAGIENISRAIDYAAQFTVARLPKAKP